MKIKSLKAKQILNSRDEPTLEVELKTDKGSFKASVPAGVSRGKYEAVSAPAEQAIKNVNEIIRTALVGKNFTSQQELDQFLINLDHTANKSELGANAILAVSIAFARALAKEAGLPLFQCLGVGHLNIEIKMPRPCFNLLEGGAHTEGGARSKNKLSIQEFMVAPDLGSFEKNLEAGERIFKSLGRVLEKQFAKKPAKGDEGGFGLAIEQIEQAFALLRESMEQVELAESAAIGLDVAASQFFEGGKYLFENQQLTAEELSDFYQALITAHNILFIEDPFDQEDWLAWQSLVKTIRPLGPNAPLIVGDDLLVTNLARMKKAHAQEACTAMILKPNQIGTVSETLEAAKLAREYGWKIIVSHRGGETEDSFIADLAVGIGAEFIKSGAPEPKERMAKYKRLKEIEKTL